MPTRMTELISTAKMREAKRIVKTSPSRRRRACAANDDDDGVPLRLGRGGSITILRNHRMMLCLRWRTLLSFSWRNVSVDTL